MIFKEMLADLKPSTVQTFISRLPSFEPAARDTIGDLILSEFIRSRSTQCRKAHFDLYRLMHEQKVPLFAGIELDMISLLVPRVEFLMRQHVIDYTEEHYPIANAQNGLQLNAMDEHMVKLRRQLRADVRHHARGIICLFGEMFKMGWIQYRSVDLAIGALLKIGTNEKLEFFCLLLLLVEQDMRKQQTDPAYGLDKYAERIKAVFAEASPNVRQMYINRNGLSSKILAQSYGIDSTTKPDMGSAILDQIYWIRSNVSVKYI